MKIRRRDWIDNWMWLREILDKFGLWNRRNYVYNGQFRYTFHKAKTHFHCFINRKHLSLWDSLICFENSCLNSCARDGIRVATGGAAWVLYRPRTWTTWYFRVIHKETGTQCHTRPARWCSRVIRNITEGDCTVWICEENMMNDRLVNWSRAFADDSEFFSSVCNQ